LHPKSDYPYHEERILKFRYSWATNNGAELDLLLFMRGRRLGVEVKRADAPTLPPSMRIALTDLRLDHLTVLYPGMKPYSLADRVSVVPLAMLAEGRIGTLFPTHGGGRMPRKGARP
jgi:hypothetical protein